jgi:hypothetical protein
MSIAASPPPDSNMNFSPFTDANAGRHSTGNHRHRLQLVVVRPTVLELNGDLNRHVDPHANAEGRERAREHVPHQTEREGQ